MDISTQKKLDTLRKYSKFLDSQFKIPGTNFRFGIDPLLSLIPVLGSFSGFITGLVLVAMSHKHGISGKTKILMLKNLFIDYIFGLIPIYGNVKDFFYKANQKNMILIEEHLLEEKHQGSGWGYIILFVFIAIITFISSLILFAWVLSSIIESLSF